MSEGEIRKPTEVDAVKKAGIKLGPGYMLDPENDAALAVLDDLEFPLSTMRPQPLASSSTESFE
ncbi:MAG TPA: hypothetical protein VKC89_02460 [Patescibacteria group bacterium]|nr:hypothetical protein [Patescibacteria group bacterium]